MVGADGGRVHIVPVRCADPCAGLHNPGWTTGGRRIVFTRVMGPFDRLGRGGSLSRAVYRPPGRQRDAPAVTARHRRRLRGLPRPVRRQRQAPDLPTSPQQRWQDGGVLDAAGRLRCPSAHPVAAGRRRPRPVPGHPWGDQEPGGLRNLRVRPPQGIRAGHRDRPRHLPSAGGLHPRDPLRHAQRRLPRTSFNPSWSPDGQRIAFTQALFLNGKPPVGDIWTMRPNGRDRGKVSRSPRFDFRPDWGR